jgi:uncharacterized protein YukJ
MTLAYGYVKAKLVSGPVMKATRRPHEIQYHLHFGLLVANDQWDVAVNIGTNDADDLLRYKLVYDFHHASIKQLGAAPLGAQDLTNQSGLPALDFIRSDILSETGRWRDSDVMDGSEFTEPGASLMRSLVKAHENKFDVYAFGRFYTDANGIHDIHMNQGSTKSFIHRVDDDSNDHNDIWQDGALFIDIGASEWVAYFAAFDQQLAPTDGLGNPRPGAGPL